MLLCALFCPVHRIPFISLWWCIYSPWCTLCSILLKSPEYSLAMYQWPVCETRWAQSCSYWFQGMWYFVVRTYVILYLNKNCVSGYPVSVLLLDWNFTLKLMCYPCKEKTFSDFWMHMLHDIHCSCDCSWSGFCNILKLSFWFVLKLK